MTIPSISELKHRLKRVERACKRLEDIRELDPSWSILLPQYLRLIEELPQGHKLPPFWELQARMLWKSDPRFLEIKEKLKRDAEAAKIRKQNAWAKLSKRKQKQIRRDERLRRSSKDQP